MQLSRTNDVVAASHPQAGAGWAVQGLELPTQTWSKTKGEGVRCGPRGRMDAHAPVRGSAQRTAAPRQAGLLAAVAARSAPTEPTRLPVV